MSIVIIGLMQLLHAQTSPYIAGQHSPRGATPPAVQAAIALSGEWLFEYGDTTNLVTISHITGKILVMENAGELSQRYLRLGDRLLRFVGSGQDNLRIAWHIEDDLLEIHDGEYAGARLTRVTEDQQDDGEAEVDENAE